MQNEPAYRIASVDHALRLALTLRQEGPLRAIDAARLLGVAPSTAHRLLAMLVYRGFAEQDEQRRYIAGPAMREPATPDLRRITLPHLQALAAHVNESVNLVVVLGVEARFVATAECTQVLRVGNREGRALPAHLASGGRAVLATLPEDEVTGLYSGPDSPVTDLPAFLRGLRRVHKQGFAVNDQGTERGVTAVGQALRCPDGVPPAAISIAMPTARYRRDRLPELVQHLAATVHRVERDLDSA